MRMKGRSERGRKREEGRKEDKWEEKKRELGE